MLIELTPELISAFELYLTTTPKLAHNTIFTYIASLKRVITKAVKNRLLAYNPFDNYHIAAKDTDVGYLNTKEIKMIMEVQLIKRLEVVRDLFLFCTFTGLSFCDMRNLTHSGKNAQIDPLKTHENDHLHFRFQNYTSCCRDLGQKRCIYSRFKLLLFRKNSNNI
jgi:hypothetical protein